MIRKRPYLCPECFGTLDFFDKTIECSAGHCFQLDAATHIPVFTYQKENISEYSIQYAAEKHDNSLAWLMEANNTTEERFREEILSKLRLRTGQNLLITGVGTGNDLPFICKKLGLSGHIYAQDFSKEMIYAASDRIKNKYNLDNYQISLSISDAVNLPFEDCYFDAVYHFGGINIYSNIAKGVREMERVVKKGGRVVFGDEGLAPWLKATEIGKMLMTNNPLYAHDFPAEYLPEGASEVEISWTINNCYYVISYTSTKSPLPIDIDLRHKGQRGGSIRTRYHGQLEGISPDLKSKLYDFAKSSGHSRVALLEQIIEAYLSEN